MPACQLLTHLGIPVSLLVPAEILNRCVKDATDEMILKKIFR